MVFLTGSEYRVDVPWCELRGWPQSTTSAIFKDFNRQQNHFQPFTTDLKDQVLDLVKFHLDPTLYQPIHFLDTLYAGMPLNTGTGYHSRHSFKIQVLSST